ncbi:hypothetical protein B0A55_01115 [Friedmanniomyces simplex]|uniref:Cytochrome P450 n=1 Tax=Friedmanniomyces simplex TaxID=329884 RepID=A0A4U0XVC9_9PEZI|nr:hypothetical protein B0A55_01115 [Friedmanniomyces simplex]
MDYPYLLVAATAPLCWLGCIALYRLFFHPLAKIPGPWLPAVTSLYSTYYDCFYQGGGQYPQKLKQLHAEHGPIIRPVPSEVHISDPEFLDAIYAMRDRNSCSAGGLMVDQSVGLTEDYALHRLRRDALNPYFSAKAVMDLQPILTSKADMLAAILSQHAESKEPLNLSDAFFAFSNDILRSFSFGSDNGLLSELPEAHRQREDLASLLMGVPLQSHFKTPMRFLGGSMTLLQGEPALPAALREMLAFRARARQDIEAVLADKANDRKGSGRSLFYELRDSSLPPHEKTVSRLQDEATLLVMAGTESPAKTLTIASFYMLSLPEVTRKLRGELAEARKQASGSKTSLNSLLVLPYLGAIIHEANRLSFGVTGRMRRYSPTQTLTYTASYGPYKDTTYTLPPGTQMNTVTYCTHTNEALFPDPWRFDPERWLGQSEEVNTRKRCMMAFGKGHRKCLGISLANAAMCLALTALAMYDMELFETDESDVKFKYDNQISQPKRDSKGVRASVRGRLE